MQDQPESRAQTKHENDEQNEHGHRKTKATDWSSRAHFANPDRVRVVRSWFLISIDRSDLAVVDHTPIVDFDNVTVVVAHANDKTVIRSWLLASEHVVSIISRRVDVEWRESGRWMKNGADSGA